MVIGLAASSFAAVENVKVGGDLTFRGFYRNGFDFNKDAGAGTKINPHFIYAGARVFVSADLTNNVSAMVRMISERDMGNDYVREITGSILLDLGYIKAADLFLPGLALTVGRQEIQFGEGLVIGSRYRAIDYPGADIGTAAVDYGQQKAFDAIRLDYAVKGAPITFSGFKAKILESYNVGTVTLPVIGTLDLEDVDVYGLNMMWKPDTFTVEPYIANAIMYHTATNIMTGGVRGTWAPAALKGLELKGEFAKQFGDLKGVLGTDSKPAGWAGYLGGGYTFPVAMKPSVGLTYNYFSGWDGTGNDVKSWIPLFPSDVASRVGKIAYPALFPAGEGMVINVQNPGLINAGAGLQSIKLGLGLQPTDKLGLGLDFFYLKTNEAGAASSSTNLGNEIDLSLKYMYTEDLWMGIDYGYFMKGDYIRDNTSLGETENAWQLIGSIGLSF